MLMSQFIKSVTAYIPATPASQVERLAKQIAVARGEIRQDQPLATLPASQVCYLRAMARACLVPSSQQQHDIVERLARVNAHAVYGAAIEELHHEDAASLYTEAELNYDTVLDALGGLPVRPTVYGS